VVKAHPEIQVVSPLTGEILGKRTSELEFAYQPKSFATAEALISIRTTEFDSETKMIRIVGNAAPSKATTDINDTNRTVAMVGDQSKSGLLDASKTLL
jgi:hypothetical protein